MTNQTQTIAAEYTGTDFNGQGSNIAWFEINGESWGRTTAGDLVDSEGSTVDFNSEYSFVPTYRAQ